MGAGRKMETLVLQKKPAPQWNPHYLFTARNLSKRDLSGVIFGCTHKTYKECIFKQLFGLPAPHIQYVQNITQGMPLFLFNYSDRKLHGIFEAVSEGRMGINSYAWTSEDQEKTQFPAQVRVKFRMQCQPLAEEQYQPILAKNYRPHEPNRIWFELDKSQTDKLISLFSAYPVGQSLPTSHPAIKWGMLFTQSVSAVAHQDCSSRTTTSGLHLRSSCDSEGNDKGKQKREAYVDDYAPEKGNVAVSGQGRSWSSLFKPQAHSISEEVTTKDTTNEVGDQVSSLIPNIDSAVFSDKVDANSFLAENSDKIAQSADFLNSEQDTNSVASDESCSIESNMEWASSLPHLDGPIELLEAQPLNATIQEEGRVMSKPCSERSNLSDMSGTADLEDKTGEDTFVFDKANASEMILEMKSSDLQTVVAKLIQTIEEMKTVELTHSRKIQKLEQELLESNRKIEELKYNRGTFGLSTSSLSTGHVKERQFEGCFKGSDRSILLVGGFDGSSWLPDLDSYSPSKDVMRSLEPMTSLRSYASAVIFDGGLYVLGGGYGTSWYDTVELYNLKSHQWVSCPPLNRKKGSLAGACLEDKIFAIGGGNATDCFSEVEMLDLHLGKWIVSRSMVQKRFAPAAAQMNGVLYVVGGYDGQDYLKSVERFDPRECAWTRLQNMTTRRGCHSLTVMNEKLYAIGGYDGSQMVPTIEVFEPRVGSWMMSEPMNYARGYLGAATLGNTIFAIGGMQESEDILDTVECYSEGEGWQLTDLKSVGKRCFFSAVVV